MAENAQDNSGLDVKETSSEDEPAEQIDTTELKAIKDRCPSDKQLSAIAQAIGENWELIGIEVGIDSVHIDQIKMDKSTTVQQILKTLLVWKQAQADAATFEKLYAAMNTVNVNINWLKLPGMPSKDIIPDDKELLMMALTIKDDWEPLARELGISTPCIEQIKLDNDSLINQKRKMLETWRGMKKQHATAKRFYSIITNMSSSLTDGELSEFLESLVILYKDEYSRVQIVNEINMPVLQFYVEPTLEIVTRSVVDRMVSRESKPISSYREIFFNTQEPCRYVFVTAGAGFGKTTFAKRLCMLWCCAKDKHKSQAETDQAETNQYADTKTLNKFDFLFLITLRNAKRSECTVEDMIFSQIVSKLPSHNDKSFIQRVLHEKKCLIILDGLDEWTHPENTECQHRTPIPHWISAPKSPYCCYLSTTRPWKMTDVVMEMENCKIDKQLKITGFNTNQEEKLISTVIKVIKPEYRQKIQEKKTREVIKELSDKGHLTFQKEPVLLIYLTCVWIDDKTIGDTKCDIYSNIVKCILSQGERKINNIKPNYLENELTRMCEHESEKYSGPENGKLCCLMRNLGELAFNALCPRNELAINSKKVGKNLFKNELWCLLHMGLLIRDRNTRLTGDVLKYSFIHKTFQEYFSAFYLVHLPPDECVSVISNTCKNLKDILKCQKVIIFLSGLHSGVFGKLSQTLCSIVADDALCNEHRSKVIPWFDDRKYQDCYDKFYFYQSMHLSCIQELHQKDVNVYVEDIFLQKTPLKVENNAFKSLIESNKKRLKSLSVVKLDIGKFHESMKLFRADQFETLEKFDLYGEMEVEDLDVLLSKCVETMRCLALCSYEVLSDGRTASKCIRFSECNMQSLQNMRNIESLTLECFFLTHEQLDILTNLLREKIQMKEIRLMTLSCMEHGMRCTGLVLDLSKHNSLHAFELDSVPVSQVNLNAESLDECFIGECQSPSVISNITESLSGAIKMQLFTCCSLHGSAELEMCLKKILEMPILYQLMFKKIDLREIDISSYIKSLEKLQVLWLFRSKIACTELYKIKEQVEDYSRSFRINIDNCEVTSPEDFEQFKMSVKSDHETFRVLENLPRKFFFEKNEDP